MWVHKHRPNTFDDMVGNEEVVRRFASMARAQQLQHLIVCGPVGVGKSTMVDILVEHVLGRHRREGLLMFDSSDDRGIQNVREKIHQFVPKLLRTTKNVPKMLVFEEAETIGEGVQQMMRRLMEKHSHHASFIFVCNQLHGIIETLQSRCQIFRLHDISPPEQLPFLRRVCAAEGCGGDDVLLTRIAQLSQGDIRRSLNMLQTCCSLEHGDDGHRTLTPEGVRNRCLYPHHDVVSHLVRELLHGSLRRAMEHTRHLYEQGYSGVDVIMFINDFVIDQETLGDLEITRAQHLTIVKQVGLAHVRLTEGVDSFCQLGGMLARIHRSCGANATATCDSSSKQ